MAIGSKHARNKKTPKRSFPIHFAFRALAGALPAAVPAGNPFHVPRAFRTITLSFQLPQKRIFTMSLASLKKHLFCAAAMMLAAGSSFAAGTLTMATEGTFPPFEFHDSKTNELIGFELDLAKAAADKMGATLDIKEFKFDAILPAIVSNTLDFAAAGFAVTPERAKRVLFSDPFYMSGLTIIVPKGNPKGIKNFDDLKGLNVSVQLGSISHDRAKKIPGAKITTFESGADAMLNMISGNADAVINAQPATDYMIVSRPSLQTKLERLDFVADAVPMAMIFPKNRSDLQKAVNKALAEIRADGTYEKLHMKWFGRPKQ